MTSLLAAKTTGLDTRPLAYRVSGSLVLAEAKMSGLIPCSIWAARRSEPANEYRTSANLNCGAYAVKAASSDEAADTVKLGLLPEGPAPPELVPARPPQPARAMMPR